MDSRIVTVFLFLCFSTGYSLKNDVDDDILEIQQETDYLEDAPEMVNCRYLCCFFAIFITSLKSSYALSVLFSV